MSNSQKRRACSNKAPDAKKNEEDRSCHRKMLECIEALQAERVKGDGDNLVKMIPSFVAMTCRSGEVYHLHPCDYVNQPQDPKHLRAGVKIIKVCEKCVRACVDGSEMGFDPKDCRDPAHWILKQRYDRLNPHQ